MKKVEKSQERRKFWNITKFITLVLFTSMFIFSACSKDDDEPETVDTPKPAVSDKTQIIATPPSIQNSQSTGATVCKQYISSINLIKNYSNLFTVPSGAKKVSTKSSTATYEWVYGSMTVTYVLTESDTKYIWNIYYQDANNPKAKVVYCEQAKDGKSGKLIAYNWLAKSEQAIYQWTWSVNSTNDFTFEFKDLLGIDFVYTVIVKNDGSGSLEVKLASEVQLSMVWDKDGHGKLIYSGEEITF